MRMLLPLCCSGGFFSISSTSDFLLPLNQRSPTWMRPMTLIVPADPPRIVMSPEWVNTCKSAAPLTWKVFSKCPCSDASAQGAISRATITMEKPAILFFILCLLERTESVANGNFAQLDGFHRLDERTGSSIARVCIRRECKKCSFGAGEIVASADLNGLARKSWNAESAEGRSAQEKSWLPLSHSPESYSPE